MTDPPATTDDRRWQLLAFGLATAAAIFLIFAPVMRAESISTSGARTAESMSLFQAQGSGVLPILMVPVVLTLIPLLAATQYRRIVSITCTALLAVGVLLAMLSVGMFFVPALAGAVVASIKLPGRAHGGERDSGAESGTGTP